MGDQEQTQVQSVADKDIEIVHDLESTPTIYIDGAQGFALANGVVRINLYQLVQHYGALVDDTTIKKVFVAKLVMAPNVLQALASWLTERVGDIDQQQEPSAADTPEPPDGKQ